MFSSFSSRQVPSEAPKGLPTIDPAEAVVRPGPIDRGDDADAAKLIGMKAPALPSCWLDGRSRCSRRSRARSS
jgi:hypothetical protein